MIFHAVLCSIPWLFLAWEEFDEEIWGEGLRPAYIENSIKFTPQFYVTLNLKCMINTVSVQIEKIKPAFSYFFTGFRADLACLFPFLLQFVFAIQSCFINTYLIMLLLVFSPRCLYLFFHIWRWGWRLGIEFLPLNWKSRHVSNLFPFSYCELMEISFHTLLPIYMKSPAIYIMTILIVKYIPQLPGTWIDKGQNVSFKITCFVL